MGKSKRQIAAARKKKEALLKKQAAKASANKVEDKDNNEEKDDTKDDSSKIEGGDYRMATGILESRPLSKDVKIGAFSLAAYGTELVKDTSLEFTIGRRYGLLGENGSGKSTLLKCLAAREVPIPDHIDIFFLENEVAPGEVSAIESVLGEVRKTVARFEEMAEQYMEDDGPESPRALELYNKLDDFPPVNQYEAFAGKLLMGLGFSNVMMRKKTKDMSGGWRMRVALAQALFIRPTLLLLDEPTNHLDLEACVWLEQELAKYPYCLLVVSHSVDFMNGVCTNIMHITRNKTLVNWTGNYDVMAQTKKEKEVNQMKRYKKEQDDIKHLKEFISSCGTYSNLVRQAKSKQKLLDKMYERGLVEKVEQDPVFNFSFATCERLAPPVMSFCDVGFSYSGKKKDFLYDGLDLAIDMDSRVALVGPNGAGKSTLLKLMVQELEPVEGLIKRHLHLKLGRYHQHSAEVLDHSMKVLDFMRKTYDGKLTEKMEEEDWRKAIGRYGITGKQQVTPIGKLSDGLRSRIIFAMLALEKPNVLLLDEPTNHLDMTCIDALAEAINTFKGGVILVSHDFRLLDQVAKDVWVCDNNTVKPFKGGIRAYKKSLMKDMKKRGILG